MQDFLGEGKSLTEFQGQQYSAAFKTADTYPEFFDKYLNDEHRIIQIFLEDPHANQRIFYFQYLKLCFEAEDKDTKVLIQNIRDLIFNPDFYFIFDEGSQGIYDSDGQYKRLIFEFMQLIEQKKYPLKQLLSSFSIMDQVFVTMFRSLLFFYGKTQSVGQYVNCEAAFATFQQIFGLQVQKYDKCIKFVDADVFTYQSSPQQVYMAYLEISQKQSESLQNQNSFSYNDFDPEAGQGSKVNEQSEEQQVEQQHKVEQFVQKQEQFQAVKQTETLKRPTKKKNQMYVSNTNSNYDFVDFTSPANNAQRNNDALDITEKNSSSYFGKQSMEQSVQLSANKPFYQAEKSEKPQKKLAVSEIQTYKTTNNNLSLDTFNQRKIQESIDLGTSIGSYVPIHRNQNERSSTMAKQLNANMNKKTTEDINYGVIQQDHDYKYQIHKKPSVATLVTNPSGNSLHKNYGEQFKYDYTNLKETSQRQSKDKYKYEYSSKANNITPKLQINKFSVLDTPDYTPKINSNIADKYTNYSVPSSISSTNKFNSFINNGNQKTTTPNKFQLQNGKYRLVLNITKQFTNSQILNIIPESPRDNIIKCRERARAYRSSIKHLL